MLSTISSLAQDIAEAIKAAFQMDVEITDESITRIAATGNAKSKIGQVMQFGTVSRNVIKNNDHVIIESVLNNPYCRVCPGLGKCTYSGGVVVPIEYNQRVIGTLNVVAYNEEKLNTIKQNKHGIIDFLYRMSDLMASKIREQKLYEEQNRINSALMTLINTIPKGIISIDEKGCINQMNHVAEKLIGKKGEEVKNKSVLEIFEDFPIEETSAGEMIQTELSYMNGSHPVTFIGDIQPIKVGKKVSGAVLSLSDYKEVQRTSFEFINSNRSITIEDIIGKSPKMIEIKSLVEHVAANHSTILITGESGTGKEMFARAIHQESPRRNHPFISINCGAIPETLIESELFGYEKGAFTGADSKGKPGKFELADQGTIFLDEIGTMPLYLQVKLLRVLQTREIDKIGGKRPIPIDVRIIAATNENLEKLVDEGKFREDLYYRLNVIPIQLPPLRERKEDIEYLSRYFIRRYNRLLNRKIERISQSALEALQSYHWPGNIRELENCVEYAINISHIHDMELRLSHLPPYIRQWDKPSPSNPLELEEKARYQTNQVSLSIKAFERTKIEQMLQELGTSTKAKKQIADALGISLATLYRKLKQYHLK